MWAWCLPSEKLVFTNFCCVSLFIPLRVIMIEEKKSCFDGHVNPLCFHTLTKEEWDEIAKDQSMLTYSKGEVIAKQGAMTSYVVFILSGLARQFIQSETVRPFNIRVIQGGEFIGLTAIFGAREFNSSVVALSQTQACLIGIDVLRSLVERNNAFALRLIKRHLQTENEFIEVVSRLHYKQMPGKLAQSLLYLQSINVEKMNIFPLLSRNDLADFAGISPVNVVKLLKQFEMERIITLDKKDIRIIDTAALVRISKRG